MAEIDFFTTLWHFWNSVWYCLYRFVRLAKRHQEHGNFPTFFPWPTKRYSSL